MDRNEAIKLLKNMHWSITTKMNREVPSSLALLMAIEALEGKDTNVPTKEDAIPVDWLLRKADWCDKNNGIFVSGAIRSAVDVWREEQNNGIDKS